MDTNCENIPRNIVKQGGIGVVDKNKPLPTIRDVNISPSASRFNTDCYEVSKVRGYR